MRRTKRWCFHEAGKVDQRFQEYFGVSFRPFYDGMMSVIFKHLMVDVIKLDDWLHTKWGDYEAEGMSMRGCIRKHYGEDAEKFIVTLIG